MLYFPFSRNSQQNSVMPRETSAVFDPTVRPRPVTHFILGNSDQPLKTTVLHDSR